MAGCPLSGAFFHGVFDWIPLGSHLNSNWDPFSPIQAPIQPHLTPPNGLKRHSDPREAVTSGVLDFIDHRGFK